MSKSYYKRSQKSGRKTIRDKGHACYFCQTILCNNLVRYHIENKHSNEIEVANILAMAKKSKKRRDAFTNLIKYGDFFHNCDVLAVKHGKLILVRRPNLQEKTFSCNSDYGPCPECLGFFLKRHIWHHLIYKCTSKLEKKNRKGLKSSPLLKHLLQKVLHCYMVFYQFNISVLRNSQ